MPAGRPRKPTAILKLEGAYQPSMHGYRGDEPQPTGRPIKPKGMSADASKFWDRMVPSLTSLGIATDLDTPSLEQMCIWWGEVKKLLRVKKRANQWTYQFASADKQWRHYASCFGMTPSDRAKLAVSGKETSDPAKEFVA